MPARTAAPNENIALHKAVMQKLAENGGVVPDSCATDGSF